MQAVGYREIRALLGAEIDLKTAIKKTQAGTRQLARRQLIWLRSLAECQMIQLQVPMNIAQVTQEIIQIKGPSKVSAGDD